MALSNSVKNWVLDPTIQNSQRVEFRLTPGILASNLVLIDAGVYSANVVDRTTGVFYPSILGCLAAFKNISLYSGSTLIDQIQELSAYGAVQHLKVSNAAQEDIHRFEILNGHSWGLKCDDGPLNTLNLQGTLTTEASHKDYVKKYNESAGVFKNLHNNQIQISSTEQGGASGMLNLSTYLKFLQSTPILSNIPDLRLILEFNTNVNDFYVDADAPTAVTPALVPIRPQLVYQEILGLEAPKGLMKIPYSSTIVERFVLPAAADGVTKFSSFRSGAFRARYVKDLMLFNKISTNDGYLRAKERSLAVASEKIQLILNQKKYLPDQGIDQEAMKIRYFSDTLGGLNIPLAAAMSSFKDATGSTFRTLDQQGAVFAHNFSVAAVNINDVVDRLDVEVTRTGSVLDSDQTSQYELLLFGTVNRLLEIKDGVVRLSY
jgi:hypothetical protein